MVDDDWLDCRTESDRMRRRALENAESYRNWKDNFVVLDNFNILENFDILGSKSVERPAYGFESMEHDLYTAENWREKTGRPPLDWDSVFAELPPYEGGTDVYIKYVTDNSRHTNDVYTIIREGSKLELHYQERIP
jgi:hypothetical protein